MIPRRLSASLCAAGLLAIAGHAVADDVTYTFDELAVGTIVTTNYYGVTFSAQPQSCSGSPTIYMRIANPTGGTASGTRCLMIDTGCPDFSSDWLRMVFDTAQSDVKFYIGDYAGTYQVRAYSTTSGSSGLISTQNITLDGTGFVGVHRLVTVHDSGDSIRRVEVQMPVGLFESIDDLTFNPDPTPPEAVITSPTEWSCVCGSYTVTGTARDPDGPYLNRTLYYSAEPGGPWTTISTSSTEVSSGTLGTWNTAALSEGTYFLRLVSTNATGAQVSTVMPCWVSRNFDTVDFALPTIVGGTAIPDGTVYDNWCGTESYTVDYQPFGGMSWTNIATVADNRINQNLAVWNTTGLVDGRYIVRVIGTNPCGHTKSQTAQVIVDNTPPTALITTPAPCTYTNAAGVPVNGTVNDANLLGWTLYYTGGDITHWVPIATSTGPVSNGLLGTWNTAGLRKCAYTLRLVAHDQAVRDGNGAAHNVAEYTVSVDLGCHADYNRSALVSVQDVFDFLTDFFGTCP